MKYFKISLLCFLLVIGVLGTRCKKYDRNVYAISIFCDYGDGNNFIFIGSSVKNMDTAFLKDTIIKPRIDELWSKLFYNYHGSDVKYLLSKDAFTYLIRYASDHCNKINRNDRKTVTKFTIHSYANEGDKICTYYYNEQLIQYFKGMLRWMEESPYKDEYKNLIVQVQLYIKQ